MENIIHSQNNIPNNLPSENTDKSSQVKIIYKRKELARRFLSHQGKNTNKLVFQTFDDVKKRKDPSLTRMLIGTLDEHFDTLLQLNERGAGVFITINQTDGQGRKLENITRVHAVFQEADRSGVPIPELEPHLEVESSPGKFHRYWLLDPRTAPSIEEWCAVMRRMVTDFGSDQNAQDPSRVLRLPGFYHQKDPKNPHPVKFRVKSDAAPYTWSKITEKIPPLEKIKHKKANFQSAIKELDQPLRISSALNAIDPDCDYLQWLKIGMALHHATGGSKEGFKLWDTWSAKGNCYRDGETEQKWATFGIHTGEPVTIATLIHYATKVGWSLEATKNDLLTESRNIIESIIAKFQTNPITYLGNESIEALQLIHSSNPNEYESLRTRLKQTNPEIPISALDQLATSGKKRKDTRNSIADALLELVYQRCELWHDKNGKAYVSFILSINGQGHTEHWPISSQAFGEWLSRLAYVELKRAASPETLKTVCNTLSGRAKFDGKEHEVFMRVGKNEMGYWIDLCDKEWRAILVTAAGWSIIDRPSIRFIRTKSMRPLPVPQIGGNMELLWQFTNIPEAYRQLVLAWILECYRCNTPYPVLELIGTRFSKKYYAAFS